MGKGLPVYQGMVKITLSDADRTVFHYIPPESMIQISGPERLYKNSRAGCTPCTAICIAPHFDGARAVNY